MVYDLRTIRKKDSKENRKFIRLEEIANEFNVEISDMNFLARAAGAKYQLPRTTLVHKKELENYMNHLYKVESTNKIVQKKYVRINEGAMIYSIGQHRFIEMARAAGAVYKIGEAQGCTVLINLELFDLYMERFHEKAKKMKNPIKEINKMGV